VQTVDLGSLAAALAPRSAAMVDEMVDMLLGQIEELRGDEQVVGRLRASIESNVSTLLHLLEQPTDLRLVEPPAGAGAVVAAAGAAGHPAQRALAGLSPVHGALPPGVHRGTDVS
jgi:hypothetical protein